VNTPPIQSSTATGLQLGLYSCPECAQVWQHLPTTAPLPLRCLDCHTLLNRPIAHRLQRTWAYILAAVILYVPANLLPVMSTSSITGRTEHTILGGIHELWLAGNWFLAFIVFTASIAVPLFKILIMVLLTFTAQRQSGWRQPERARLYRLIEAVGHWSMLDVLVVLLLVGMIRFGPFAGVAPESGLISFGAVVILTLLATHSFDTRLIWPTDNENSTA
jgi:paraquat-inducible protein A